MERNGSARRADRLSALRLALRLLARAMPTTRKNVESIGKTIRYLSHTVRESHDVIGISITAGVIEEIVYRPSCSVNSGSSCRSGPPSSSRLALSGWPAATRVRAVPSPPTSRSGPCRFLSTHRIEMAAQSLRTRCSTSFRVQPSSHWCVTATTASKHGRRSGFRTAGPLLRSSGLSHDSDHDRSGAILDRDAPARPLPEKHPASSRLTPRMPYDVQTGRRLCESEPQLGPNRSFVLSKARGEPSNQPCVWVRDGKNSMVRQISRARSI